MTLPLLAVGAVGVDRRRHPLGGEVMAELIAAFDKGDLDRARELNAPLFDSYAYENREIAQFALAGEGGAARARPARRASAGCRSGPRPRASRTMPARCSTASACCG